MSIKLIAIDLDDTLLRDDISISDYTKKTLQAALAKGVRIVIATGRMFQAARPWGQAIGLGDVPMICYTGALTGLCESGKIIRNVTVEKEKALDILSTIKEEGWYAHTYIDDELHVPYYDWRTKAYEHQCRVKAHVDGEAFYHPEKEPTKILVCEYYDQKMKEIDGILRKKYGDAVNQVKSKPYFFEMNHKDCSKGNAIRAMCALYGISIENTMTFGNGNNDVSMLSITPWSFAVANASDSAKAAASHETASNNEDGVAKAVEKYVLEG
jgi:Cof subfamily protein (haloacid dehalogenase superfamily)